MNKKTKKAALVLSGGGTLGAAHIGAVKILQKKGFEFDFLAGVSAGSIVCAFVACGKSADEAEDLLHKLNVLTMADLAKNQFGIVGGNKIKKFLDEIYENKSFKDINVPLYIGATDFSTGDRVIINKGKIADAVRASISVPVLFEPFYHPTEKRWLADGGLSQNLPLDIAIKKYKGSRIFSIDVASNFATDIDFAKKERFSKIKKLRLTLERTFRIFYKNQQINIPHDKRVVKICPDLADFTAADIFKMEAIRMAGEKAAKKVMI